MRFLFFFFIALVCMAFPPVQAQEALPVFRDTVDSEGYARRQLTYKRLDTIALDLTFYYPLRAAPGGLRPAIIFFFGGGWRGGTIEQFAPHARHYAAKGMIAVLADYRVESRHGTTPYEAAADAKSAIRFLRRHAAALGIDPQRIAGGHLAAAAGTIDGLDEPGEDAYPSSQPNALVLFNPVFDNGPTGYGFDRVGGEAGYRRISPLHNIGPGAPPTIVFLGTEDPLIPVGTAQEYCRRMQGAGRRCELYLYEGQGHGFFNYRNSAMYEQTVAAADAFLASLGYIR